MGIGTNMACARLPTGFVDKWAQCFSFTWKSFTWSSFTSILRRPQLIKVGYEMRFQAGAKAYITMDAITNSGTK